MTLEIQVLAWDRHAYVAGLNRLMGSYPYPLDICYICMLSTVYCHISVCYTFTHKEIPLTYHISLQSTINAKKISYICIVSIQGTITLTSYRYFPISVSILQMYCLHSYRCNDDNLSLEKIQQYRHETGKHFFFLHFFYFDFCNRILELF